ncbi:MAG: ABC transporter ATP-binding protein, partial [Candidatus Omnitrophica bacterium]|nr:ABC transporter ATP-binding protein [Candidatus Omnitrophota bacterium]
MLKIINLTCGYGTKIVLYDISFNINRGEFLGIIGPNGSGKTTLLRTLSRTIAPMKGEILVEGKNIRMSPLKELAKTIAVVSQSPLLNHMTVEEFVLLGRIPHYQRFQFLEAKKDLEIAGRSMDLTGIFKLKDQSLSQISG